MKDVFKIIQAMELGLDYESFMISERAKSMRDEQFNSSLDVFIKMQMIKMHVLQSNNSDPNRYIKNYTIKDTEPANNLGDMIEAEYSKRALTKDEVGFALRYCVHDFHRSIRFAHLYLNNAIELNPDSEDWRQYISRSGELSERAATDFERVTIILKSLPTIGGERVTLPDNIYESMEMQIGLFRERYTNIIENPYTFNHIMIKRALTEERARMVATKNLVVEREVYETAAELRDEIARIDNAISTLEDKIESIKSEIAAKTH